MLLERKQISPSDNRRYTIDYSDWLDDTETLSTVTFAVDTGPATVGSHAISADGKSVVFFVTGAVIATPTFNVAVQATSSAAQIKNDHVEFNVVSA